MDSLQLASPAKLNLFLHVQGRRPDGYHLLQSLFVLIDWVDEVHLRRHSKGILRLGPLDWPVEDDLGYRAALLLREEALRLGRTDEALGCEIRVEKSIPAGAGLGGGSSNAATVLLGLNALWGLDLKLPRLKQLGLQLGADVPFFLHGEAAFAEGVGEALQSLPVKSEWFAVAVPSVAVSTGRIFQDPALTRDTKALRISGLANPARDLSWQFGHNDLEPVARRLVPEVGELMSGFRAASRQIGWTKGQSMGQIRMSGSGGAVFGSCESEEEAHSLVSALQAVLADQDLSVRSNVQCRVCQQLSQSPVHLQVPLR